MWISMATFSPACFVWLALVLSCCIHGHEQGIKDGFIDCMGIAISDSALTRAWRRFMRNGVHPDKGGSQDLAVGANELRAQLRDPLRMHLARLLRPNTKLTRLGAFSEHRRHTVSAIRLEWVEGWPYITFEVSLELSKELSFGAGWDFAIGANDIGTIHYHGDETKGGYDVCCDFIRGSACARRPAAPACNASIGSSDTCTSVNVHADLEESPYIVHDCPIPKLFAVTVRKPLHVNEAGRWGSVLQVRDEDGIEVACLAASFEVLASSNKNYTNSSFASSSDYPNGTQKADVHKNGGDNGGGSTRSDSRSTKETFKFLRQGHSCGDGGDILEGPVDNYGFGGEGGFYGGRCRDKCHKRPRCRFYTAFSSGWCQLSTRCLDIQPANDPLAVTFEKT